jgi:hypothetical protein
MANSNNKTESVDDSHAVNSDSRTINASVSSESNKKPNPIPTDPKLTAVQKDIAPELVAVDSTPNTSMTPQLSFYPSRKQRVFLNTALRSDKHEIKAVAKQAGISRGAWYDWIKDDKFVKWYNESWQKALDAQAWKLDAMGIKQASGNYKYWKAMQQRSGRLLEGTQVNTQVNLGGFNVDFIVDED